MREGRGGEKRGDRGLGEGNSQGASRILEYVAHLHITSPCILGITRPACGLWIRGAIVCGDALVGGAPDAVTAAPPGAWRCQPRRFALCSDGGGLADGTP